MCMGQKYVHPIQSLTLFKDTSDSETVLHTASYTSHSLRSSDASISSLIVLGKTRLVK